ncbi:hypothetical protein C8Q72DRAFT_881195 [Fomitopsis betulina]|nr:hypothetical protein C8Q72DRAFT_881195 [Fomitopsis betulina]
MLNDVVRQLCGVKTDPGYVKRPYTGVFYLHDIIHFHGVTNERMDLVYSTVERRKGVTADFESAFVEVKKEDRDSKAQKGKAQEEKAQEGNAHRAKAKALEGTQPSQSGTGPTDWTTRVQLDVRRAVSAPAGSRPGKRKRGSGEDDYDAPDAKRRTGSQMQPLSSDARVRSLTDNEAQAVRYMNNLMSSNVRSFGIGLLIETDDMRLWYGDRMGLIVSKKYKWLKEDNWIFLRCIAAIAQASVHEMGIFPFLQFPIKDGETMFTSYEGAYLSITACPYDGEAAEEAKDAEKLEFALAVKDPHVYAEFGVVGRGTSVLAVVAKPDTKARELYKDEGLVAKISWPHEARQAEDVLIKAVRRALKKEKPQYLPNIVDLKCSVTRSIEEIGLPRVAMGILPEARDLRICRTLVMKRYQRLEMLETVDDFKKIYIQIVRAHYWVYETSYILHRDLSINNIMWYRIGDRLVAVLCDWDLAEHQINGPTSSRPVRDTQATPPVGIPKAASQTDAGAQPVDPALKPRYRTGTGPFMAMDLLRKGAPPPHLYRYDLESLFYILICVCAALDLKTKTFRRLFLREQESLLEIGRIKREFLTGGIKEYETFFKGCSTAFKSLFTGKKSWARQLWYQFSAVERAYDKIVEAEDAESRSDTDSQEDDELQEAEAEEEEEEEEEEVGPPVKPKVTVPLSQPSVEELKAQRETLIGYAQFMAILGAPKSIRAPA